MEKLTDDQKAIIRKIESESIKNGVNPDFAIAIANLESNFNNVPSDDKKSTAFGPFQVNKSTAEANGVDYEQIKKNPDLAISTGIQNLVRHIKNPNLMSVNPDTGAKELDPFRVVAAHRYGENSDFAKTGDSKYLTPELRNYTADIMEHFPEGKFPDTLYTAPKEEKNDQQKHNQVSDNSLSMGSVPLEGNETEQKESQNSEDFNKKLMAATLPSAVGATVGAVKAPLFNAAKSIYNATTNRLSGKNGTDTSTSQNVSNEPEISVEEPKVTTPESTPGGKWGEETGFGIGEGSVEDVNKAYKRMAPDKRSKVARTYFEKFGSRAMDELRSQKEISDWWKQHHSDVDLQNKIQAQNKAIQDYKNYLISTGKLASGKITDATDYLSNLGSKVLNSAPVKLGLGLGGAGLNAESAYQNFQQNTPLGNLAGYTNLAGTGASLASMLPKVGGLASKTVAPLTYGAQAISDYGKGDKGGAEGNAYMAALSALPLSMAISALIPSQNLNKGEEEDLKQRQQMPMTIYSGKQ